MQVHPIAAHPSLHQYAELYKEELLSEIIPFWIKYSRDHLNDGFFTCLDARGQVYDTDKFTWLQGRQVWCFSMLYEKVEARPEWLDMALCGARFLKKYGRDKQGDWYFSLTASGEPLTQPYSIFSDCFAGLAFAALSKIQPDDEYKQIAAQTFERIWTRRHEGKGKFSKDFPEVRSLKNFSLPMIMANLALEMEHILGSARVEELIPGVIYEIMEVFYQPEFGLILENVSPTGAFVNCFEGRLLNPGHAIEAMWFVMDLGERLHDPALIIKAKDIMLTTITKAWDSQHGGIYYFLDVKNYPSHKLEWDQKLWWVHVEALVGLAKGFRLTGDPRCQQWFERIHAYTWAKFRDPQRGEWFGYLNRQGDVLLPLKGGKWKGCYHIPRAMYQVWQTLSSLEPSPDERG